MINVPSTFKNKRLTHLWHYKDLNGALLGGVARYDDSNGKDTIPFFKKNGNTFEMGGAETPRPLFGLETVSKSKELAFIVEGEKCASALQSLNQPALTSPGGSNQASKANWEPLSGIKKVIILPDNDTPGASYAKEVATCLKKLSFPPEILVLKIPNLPEGGDVIDWLQTHIPSWDGLSPIPDEHSGIIKQKFIELVQNNSTPLPKDWDLLVPTDWVLPIPLDSFPLPSWPNDVFQKDIELFIQALAISTETPIELPAMMVMAVLGTICAGKFVVEVTADYREPVNIWTCVALPPASLKTAILKAVLPPLRRWEKEKRNTLEPEIKRLESEHKSLTEVINHKRKLMARSKSADIDILKTEIAELEAKLPLIPKCPQIWSQDVTAEKLTVLLYENDERMGIFTDEGGIFENMAGRYSGGVPNLDIYLQSHSASPVRVSRQGRPSIMLEQPCLSIGIAPQPEVLSKLADKPGFRGRGLLARFLYALPASNLGFRKREMLAMPEELRNNYDATVTSILNLPWNQSIDGQKQAYPLRLTQEAYLLFNSFAQKVEKELAEEGVFAQLQDWAGKLPGAVIRIAGLLHIARHAQAKPWEVYIQKDDVNAAIKIADCLSIHALKVFDLMGADPSVEGAKKILKWLEKNQTESFTFRDCHYGNKNHFKRAADLEGAIDVLEERNYIKKLPSPLVSHRPSRLFKVNPSIYKIKPSVAFVPENGGSIHEN
ncbi:DUF3987 domain-containing protein [bacterium]|nr:DUF3987 domain-containing protein [bacterium]